MRTFGRLFWGIKGVDFILRTFHHPNHRSRKFFETEADTLWGGPRDCVASNSFTEWTTYFIKIDVEGAEHLVLACARETLARFRPAIIFENNAESSEKAASLLHSLGYDLSDLSNRPLVRRPGYRLEMSDFLALPR